MWRRFNEWLFDMDGMGIGCLFRFIGLGFIVLMIIIFIMALIIQHGKS